MLIFRSVSASIAAALCSACAVPVTLDFPVGPMNYEVSTDDLMIPTALQDGSGQMPAVPCNAGQCPVANPESPLVMSCEAETCDPDPYPFSLDLPPVDLSAYGDLNSIGDHITEAELSRLQYQVDTNTLNVELPAMTLYWGPETAASREDSAVMRLGALPTLGAGTTPTGEIELDPAGQRALADYFVHTSTIFRIFAETTVDLEPGMPLPQGTVHVLTTLDVHLEGEGGF